VPFGASSFLALRSNDALPLAISSYTFSFSSPTLCSCFPGTISQQDTTTPAPPSTDQAHSLWNCPVCGGTMRVVERLSAAQLLLRSPPQRTGAQHEVLLTSSVTARASARTQIPCLIWSGLLGWLFLLPSTASLSCFTQPSHRRSRTSYPTRPVPDTSPPAQIDSKYIAFHKVHSLP
jgi:hypothetical protein